MAPITTASNDSNHQQLMDRLDVYGVRKPFRNPAWKAAQRRNKNVKQIVSEAQRKEASVIATQNNSGTSTPVVHESTTQTGDATPVNGSIAPPNLAQASQNLSKLVLERNLLQASSSGPAVTYTNIESAPSLHPSSQRRYCDITGLPAPYTDPKTRLRYRNGEIFAVIRTLPQSSTEQYLAARGAFVALK